MKMMNNLTRFRGASSIRGISTARFSTHDQVVVLQRWRQVVSCVSSQLQQRQDRISYFSTATTTTSSKTTKIRQVRQISVSDLTADDITGTGSSNNSKNNDDGNTAAITEKQPGTLYHVDDSDGSWRIQQQDDDEGEGQDVDGSNRNKAQKKFDIAKTSKKSIALLLPAGYPKSVAPNYTYFAGFCFTASIAGSAAMVLSTQTLLLAVGVVGQNVQQASIMAGAWNWVMKDFVGQLGGVVFASQMGKTRAFDTDPKRWRMVAAMALDGATLLEILSPLFHSSLVLPVASIANIGKNIGFLTASASRAALHNAVAITGNLGDVTAKAGSQSIMASLIGTSLGIGLSSLLQHDTYNFALGFLGLTVIHQGCNYLSVQHVPLAHFNKQRLCLVIESYINDDDNGTNELEVVDSSIVSCVPSPSQVAKSEQFFPLTAPADTTKDWLRVGQPVSDVFADPSELDATMSVLPDEPYLIRVNDTKDKNDSNGSSNNGCIDLVFLTHATGEDIIKGMYHACLLRKTMSISKTMTLSPLEAIESSHNEVCDKFPSLLEQIHTQGWNTSTDVTHVEGTNAFRFQIE